MLDRQQWWNGLSTVSMLIDWVAFWSLEVSYFVTVIKDDNIVVVVVFKLEFIIEQLSKWEVHSTAELPLAMRESFGF